MRVAISRSAEDAAKRFSIDSNEVSIAGRLQQHRLSRAGRTRLLTLALGALPLIEVLAEKARRSIVKDFAVIENYPLEFVEYLRFAQHPDLLLSAGGDDVCESIPGGIVPIGAAIDCESPPVVIVLIEVAFDFCCLIEN